MNKKFLDSIASGNLVSVRLSLSNELLLDPRGDSYREMKALAESRLADLYEPHEGTLVAAADFTYTEDALYALKNELDSNFSRERLALYEQVVPIILKDKVEQMSDESGSMPTADNADSLMGYPRDEVVKGASIAATAVGVGLTVAGIAHKAAGLAITGAATAAIGAIGTLSQIKKKNRKDE